MVGRLAYEKLNVAGILGANQRSNRGGVVDGRAEKKVRVAVAIRNGLLCRSCRSGNCFEQISKTEYVEVECPCCGGVGCKECEAGNFRLTTCGHKYVGGEIIKAINLASLADRHLPSAGGLLDQSAWFLDLLTMFQGEQNRIDAERIERASRGR
jgi:hypothetical protein